MTLMEYFEELKLKATCGYDSLVITDIGTIPDPKERISYEVESQNKQPHFDQ